MSLLDRLVPASALRWGRLTSESAALPALWDIEAGRTIVHPSGSDFLRSLGRPFDGTYTERNRNAYFLAQREAYEQYPDPAAAWGEADRRAEGQQ